MKTNNPYLFKKWMQSTDEVIEKKSLNINSPTKTFEYQIFDYHSFQQFAIHERSHISNFFKDEWILDKTKPEIKIQKDISKIEKEKVNSSKQLDFKEVDSFIKDLSKCSKCFPNSKMVNDNSGNREIHQNDFLKGLEKKLFDLKGVKVIFAFDSFFSSNSSQLFFSEEIESLLFKIAKSLELEKGEYYPLFCKKMASEEKISEHDFPKLGMIDFKSYCFNHIYREIILLSAPLIISFGSTSLSILFREKLKIQDSHGKGRVKLIQYECKSLPVTIYPTFDLEYFMLDQKIKKSILSDLGPLKSIIKNLK